MSKISDELRNMDNAWLNYMADRIDSELVELPKDADGVPIHVGDVMEWCDSGETIAVFGVGNDILFCIDGENAEWTAARNKRHHVPDTWERIADELDEQAGSLTKDGYTWQEDAIHDFADRIRKLAKEQANE